MVNTGAYATAVALFDVLLADFPGLVAAQMAKGSACAMSGDFGRAVACFTAAIEADRSCFDAWKRRGQTQAARGDAYLPTALADLNQAEKLDAAATKAAAAGKLNSQIMTTITACNQVEFFIIADRHIDLPRRCHQNRARLIR